MFFFLRRRFFIASVLLFSLFLHEIPRANGQPVARRNAFSQAPKRVALGYYPAQTKRDPETLPWRYLTHIAHAFLQADEHGNLLPSRGLPNKKLIAAAHKNKVRVLLSLGGGDSITAFSSITSDSKRLELFVENLIKYVDKNEYDGIDIDWEFPKNEKEKQGYTKLAKALRASLDQLAKQKGKGRHYELTAAISESDYFGRWLDEKTLRTQFDFLNIMTYDMSGPWSRYAAHHAPLSASKRDPQRQTRSVEASMKYWSLRRQIPKNKLCLGIPLYGHLFPVKQPYTELKPTDRTKHKTLTYIEIKKLEQTGWAKKWDYDAQVPWMLSPDGSGVIAYDDRYSVSKKATWGYKQKYRGMFFWALGQDRTESGKPELIQAAVRAWPK